MVLETSRPPEPSSDSFKYSSGGASIVAGRHVAAGHVAAQQAAALVQVAISGLSVGRPVERRVARRFVGNRNFEARAEVRDLLLVELLLLVRDVAAFAGFAQAVALDGVGQDQRGLALGLERLLDRRCRPSCGSWPPRRSLTDFFVAQVRDQVEQFGILAEEMLADVGAVLGDVGLELAVHHFAHALLQQAGGVARQQRIPIRRPRSL